MLSRPNHQQVFICAACFAMLGLLGWVDYITGYELGFFVFYSAPVGIAAWYLGRWPAVGISFAASLAWWLADSYAGAKYSTRFSFYWNNGIHFASFIINAVAIAKVKAELDRRHQLAADLEAVRRALRTLVALLPACPGCGKPHDLAIRGGAVEKSQVFQSHAELAGALCADCRSLNSEVPMPSQAKLDGG